MIVKCTSAGCSWENELRFRHEHLKTCGLALIPCANGCKEEIIQSMYPSHRTEKCPLRWYTCEHCKSEGTYKEMTGGHLDECPDLMVPCPNNGCEDSIKRNQMASHHSKCPYETIKCPYEDVGCTYTSARHTMENHKATSCSNHLDLAIVQLKNQHVKDACFDEFLNKATSLDDKVNSCDQVFDQVMVQLKNLDHKASSHEDVLKLAMVKLGQYYAQNPYVIKLPGFNEFKANNRVWYSPRFYTHAQGYKLCLAVYANGNGDGKGTHMSVYLCLMKGENDDTLTWPMRCKCTITLLNQLKDEGHYSSTWINEENESNSRVLGEADIGLERGYAKFIHLDKLGQWRSYFPYFWWTPQENKECQYLKDDSLYFRVQVEVLPACKPWLIVTVPTEVAA